MPGDVRPARSVPPEEHTHAWAQVETSERGDPAQPAPDPANPSASCPLPPGGCRECLAALAHRLAQPATALRGGIELALLRKHSVEEYQSILEQSFELADRMAQLIVSLRDLGESGAPAGPPQKVALEPMVREVQGEIQALADIRELHFQITAEGSTNVCVNPHRFREAFQSLLAWIIQNSAGGNVLAVEVSTFQGEARVVLVPPRMDLQYLQIRMLEDVANPGLLFSYATKNGALGWAINQRLVDSLGGKLEIVTEGPGDGCICMRLPLVPAT